MIFYVKYIIFWLEFINRHFRRLQMLETDLKKYTQARRVDGGPSSGNKSGGIYYRLFFMGINHSGIGGIGLGVGGAESSETSEALQQVCCNSLNPVYRD